MSPVREANLLIRTTDVSGSLGMLNEVYILTPLPVYQYQNEVHGFYKGLINSAATRVDNAS